jgi:hypothetical protein
VANKVNGTSVQVFAPRDGRADGRWETHNVQRTTFMFVELVGWLAGREWWRQAHCFHSRLMFSSD